MAEAVSNALDQEVVDYIWRRMGELKISQRALAERAGMDESGLSRLLSRTQGARLDTIRKIADALGVTPGQLLLAGTPYRPESAEPAANSERRSTLRPLPVFSYAAAGDPTSIDDRPIPVGYHVPPPGKELVIGPNGFGVEVRGDSMIGAGINDGEIVWVNPEMRPRPEKPVVAFVKDCATDPGWSREDGIVVKLYSRRQGSSYGLMGHGVDGMRWLDCREARVIGPVVGISSWRTPE